MPRSDYRERGVLKLTEIYPLERQSEHETDFVRAYGQGRRA